MIRLKNLSKSFGRAKALDGLTLAIDEGEKVALIGANGAGKTTLFRCLLGQYEHEGETRIAGCDPRRARTETLDKIGFVPQSPPALKMPVGDLIDFANGVSGAPEKRIAQVAAELGLDVSEIRSRPFFKLSGGQKQKLLIAIALGREARLLILDEPAANLDPPARTVLFEMLSERRDDTMLVSSHRIDEVAGLATRVVELDRGRVVFDDRALAARRGRRPVRVAFRVDRPDPTFAEAMREWGLQPSEGDTVWSGAVAGLELARLVNVAARYSALLQEAGFGSEHEKGQARDAFNRCA